MSELVDRENLIEDTVNGVWYDPETGEIVDVLDAPESFEDAESLAEWLGEALASGSARLAGLEAEKAAWLERVSEQYDADIARAKRKIDWLRSNPAHLEKLKGLFDQQSGGRPSMHIGLLTMRLKRSRESLEVADEARALAYVREKLPEALKVTERVLVSAIDADTRAALPEDCGLVWHPAGETETFEVEG